MRPVLFVWGGFAVRSFHVMVYAALLVAVFLTVHFARTEGLNADRTAAAVLLLFIPGFAGARLLYVARHWDRFGREPARILSRSEGGLSLYGGFIGMFAGSVALLGALDLPFAQFWDALALGTLGGVAVAKGACLLNGCCHGRPTDRWCGVNLPDHNGAWQRRFPSQVLEMAWAAIVLLALVLARSSISPPSGTVAVAALAFLPAGRLFLQKLREEGAEEDAAVRKTCVILIAAALVAGLLVLFR